ncbi:MAG: hypothetical protein WA738_22190 [Candidatus Angelobacter sp.]
MKKTTKKSSARAKRPGASRARKSTATRTGRAASARTGSASARKSQGGASSKPAGSSSSKPLVAKQPQSKQQAALQHGMFLYTGDAWSLAYFNSNDLHCVERELFG